MSKNKHNKQGKLAKGSKDNVFNPLIQKKEDSVFKEYMDRFHWYSQKRKPYEALWEYGDRRYEIEFEERAKDKKAWNANSFVPIDHGLVLTALSDITNVNSGVFYTPRNEDSRWKAELFNIIHEATWVEGGAPFEFYKQELECFIRGTGLAREYHEYTEQDLKYFKKYDPMTGKGEYEIRKRVTDLLKYKHLDDYDLWVDPMGIDFDTADDTFERMNLSKDEAKTLFGSYPGWGKIKPGKIVSSGDMSKAQQENEQSIKDPNDRYEFLVYKNQKADKYAILGNGGFLLDPIPMPMDHKMLDYTRSVWILVPKKFYGLGIPHQIATQVEEIQTNRNIRLDNANMKNGTRFLKKKSLKLSEDELRSVPNMIIEVEDKDDITELQVSDVSIGTYKEEDTLKEDIKRVTGIDDTLVGVGQGKTATETAILKEAALKRLQLHLFTLQNETLRREGVLRMWNIRQHWANAKMVDKVMGPTEAIKVTMKARQVLLKNKELFVNLDNKGKKVVGGKFIQSSEDTFFPIMNGMIEDADLDVSVNTSALIPISQGSLRQEMDQLYKNMVGNPLVDKQKLTEMYLDAYGKNPDEILSDQPPGPPPVQDKPKVSINFKDLPPEGQIQAAGEAGIKLGAPQGSPPPQNGANPGNGAPQGPMNGDQSQPPQGPGGPPPLGPGQVQPQGLPPFTPDITAVKVIKGLFAGQKVPLNPQPNLDFVLTLIHIIKLPDSQQFMKNPRVALLMKSYVGSEIEDYMHNGGQMAPIQEAISEPVAPPQGQPANDGGNGGPSMQAVLPDRNMGQAVGQPAGNMPGPGGRG